LANERRDKNKSGMVSQVTMEDRLARLEEDIRRLKIEYDIYFNGGSKRAPYDTKLRVESQLKRLSDDRALTFAQRFHYNSLATRYNSFREIWRRTLKGREEGRDAVTVGRAARQAEHRFTPSSFACKDVQHDVETVKGLYDALMEAKRSCGEPTHDLSFSRFHRIIVEKTEAMKNKIGTDRVLFSVDVDSGHVSFKARVEK